MRSPAPPTERDVVLTLAGCGAAGLLLGVMWRPAWQDAIEPAQVLAGLVGYPPDNPVYLYSTRTWTVLHQAGALLLAAGVSERTLSLVLSGMMGMLSFQALGMCALAVGGDLLLALLAPAFILLTNTASGGVTYPVHLLGVSFTYGTVGLSWVLLAIALMAAGQPKWGALLLGFSPAVHLTIGTLAVVAVSAAAMLAPVRGALHTGVRHGAAGLVAAVASAAAHSMIVGTPVPIGVAAVAQYWDDHRRPFPLFGARALATWLSAAIPALWLARFRRDLPAQAHVLTAAIVSATVVGMALSLSYWLPPGAVPHVLPALMPSRLLNLGVLACMALFIGLSARYRSSAPAQSAVAAMVVALAAFAAWSAPGDDPRPAMAVGWLSMGMAAVVMAVAAERRRRGTAVPPADPRLVLWLRRATVGTMTAALCAAVIAAAAGFDSAMRQELRDRTNDPLLAAAAARPGLLLTGGNTHQIQLVTRRPVLVDGGALDALAYVPEAGPETARILRAVYGLDLPAIQRGGAGQIPDEGGRAVWEAREAAEWRRLGREFGFTDVLADRSWSLRLPPVAANAAYVLYAIPPQD